MTASPGRTRRVLMVGESWIKHTVHMKGFDHFVSVEYEEGAGIFLGCLAAAGFDVTYVRAHEVSARFPREMAELEHFDAVILSDIGSNSFLLPDETFLRSQASPNRLTLLSDFVADGGGLVKIGGYMSFTGIDGRARYGMSPLAPVLPVELLAHDDRIECPEGRTPVVSAPGHVAIGNVPSSWPPLLGYNRVIAKSGSTVLATVGDDPLLVVGGFGQGRVAAFMSDIAPHWAPPQFTSWAYYDALWTAVLDWACGHAPVSADRSVDAPVVAAAIS